MTDTSAAADRKAADDEMIQNTMIMKKTLKIEGMTCPNCERHVVKALEALPGVVSATADHVAGSASVDLDSEVSDADFKKAIEEDAGYKLLGIE